MDNLNELSGGQQQSRELLAGLIDRTLHFTQIHEIQSAEKDTDRFDNYVELLQERVPWSERILLPIHDHLFIVAKGDGGGAITKAACGQEFGDWRENWKLHCVMRTRTTEEELMEIYPPGTSLDLRIIDFREFYCPGCGTLLDVDTAPPNYPLEREFFPDLATFYTEWLGRPLPVDVGVWEDRSQQVVDTWAVE
jgi:acetone carboxylase gamma subunit